MSELTFTITPVDIKQINGNMNHHICRLFFRVVRGSNVNALSNNDDKNEEVQEGNQAGKYWTIVSNAKGEMSTAIETDVELQRETLMGLPNGVPTNSESEDSMRSEDIYVSQEIEGLVNPISSCTLEFNDYIHPIHSNILNTFFPTEDSLTCDMNMSMRREVKSISI
ncbi:hypothetical protein CHS0354_025602 [Potamilus streckersoni]|uniref:Uncharacterized protein n=1 Tax=Potamilus streckersoni TaxID=2493646 RepID=A0AAE0VMV0_9BIVA|nr:hypothetical protein CHS0354_025602 [Potamilus streckersoni]